MFHAALERPIDERHAFLSEQCKGQPDLFAEVKALLDNEADAGDLERLVDRSASDWLNGKQFVAGDRVGAYRIVAEIGRGGMGTVYCAERADDQYEQQVAIKVIGFCGADVPDLLRRFQDERQILAQLQHPNISRLLDGGSLPDGSPYLVMEYIDGEPIDRYCRNHQLSAPDILRLFTSVCGAVAYAHQNLVIHRDLKPANILVTKDGEVKLTDFGVAKLTPPVQQESAHTVLDARVLTPLYASPEQLNGDPVTTLTDLYSLGLVLYQLLTGRLPFDESAQGTYKHAQQVVESDPLSPSSYMDAPKKIDRWRDLDNIVLKTLQRFPAQRYASVSAMSEDIANYLSKRPVQARPRTWAYLLRRFVQRNRLTSALALTSLLAVVTLGSMAWYQAVLAASERDIAQDQLAQTRAVLALVEEIFTGLDPNVSQGQEVSVREMLDEAATRLAEESGADSAGDTGRAVLHRVLGGGYNQLGHIDSARQQMQAALSYHRSGRVTDDEERLRTLFEWSRTLNLSFEHDAALAVSQESLALARSLYGDNHPDTFGALYNVASNLHMQGELLPAREMFYQVYEGRRALWGESDGGTIQSLSSVGVIEHWLGNYDKALEAYGRCEQLSAQHLGEGHSRRLRCLEYQGLVLESMDRHAQAVTVLEEHIRVAGPILGEDFPNILRSQHSLADAYRGLGQLEKAEALFVDVLERRRKVLGANHIETLQTEMKLARVYRLSGDYQSAAPLIEHALDEHIRQQGFSHAGTLIAAQEQADLFVALGQLQLAEPLLQEILQDREEALGADHPELRSTLIALARVDLSRSQYSDAIAHLERALLLSNANDELGAATKLEVLELLVKTSASLGDAAAQSNYEALLAEYRS